MAHAVTVVSRNRLVTAMEALRAICVLGGDLEAFRMNRRGDVFEHKLMLSGLGPAQARLLCRQVSALEGVQSATVEHQVLPTTRRHPCLQFAVLGLLAVLALARPSDARAQAAPPARTRVVILGVDHSNQLVSSADQPGLLEAFIAKLHPDAICIERPPELAAKGDYYEFTYETQGVVLPYAAAHKVDICPVDWMPSTEDQMLAFGTDFDRPPLIRPPATFMTFPDPKALSEGFLMGEDPTVTEPVRTWATTTPKDAARDFPRRLYLYRTFLQGRRIAAAAKAHPGKTVLVVIGYFHKADLEASLGGDPSILLVQPSAAGAPEPSAAEMATTPSQRAAILSFNLLGRQAATGNVDWAWMERVLAGLEQAGPGPEAALFRLRLDELTRRIDPVTAATHYRELAERTDPALRFRWTGVKDAGRLDSYFDPFGNLSVAQRARLEWARTLAEGGRMPQARSEFMRLRAQLAALPARQLDAYGAVFLPAGLASPPSSEIP